MLCFLVLVDAILCFDLMPLVLFFSANNKIDWYERLGSGLFCVTISRYCS